MSPAPRAARILALSPLLVLALAGCAATSPAVPARSPTGSPAASRSAAAPTATGTTRSTRTARMAMPAPTGRSGTAAAGKPTSTQALVCGGEIRDKVREVLKLTARPSVRSRFAAGLYTCVYRLPVGPMRLSVQHSATAKAARGYLHSRSAARGADQVLRGLGTGAYGTGTGVVLVIKDDETLEVDTTALPAIFGSEQQHRSDLAYEIASDVLGCWTGDDDS